MLVRATSNYFRFECTATWIHNNQDSNSNKYCGCGWYGWRDVSSMTITGCVHTKSWIINLVTKRHAHSHKIGNKQKDKLVWSTLYIYCLHRSNVKQTERDRCGMWEFIIVVSFWIYFFVLNHFMRDSPKVVRQ